MYAATEFCVCVAFGYASSRENIRDLNIGSRAFGVGNEGVAVDENFVRPFGELVSATNFWSRSRSDFVQP